MATRNRKLLAADSILMLSDEQSNSDEEEKMLIEGESGPTAAAERPGTAELLASVIPMDFRDISSEALFGKRREVYRLEA